MRLAAEDSDAAADEINSSAEPDEDEEQMLAAAPISPNRGKAPDPYISVAAAITVASVPASDGTSFGNEDDDDDDDNEDEDEGEDAAAKCRDKFAPGAIFDDPVEGNAAIGSGGML